MTAYNFVGQSAGYAFGAVVGITTYLTFRAIQLAKVDASGFVYVCGVAGLNIENNDVISIRIRSAHDGTPAAGTYRYNIFRGAANVANGALATSLAAQPNYATDQVTYTVAGFAAGDTLAIGVANYVVTDKFLYVAEISVNQVEPVIADLAGGATLADTIAKVNVMLASLRNLNEIAI